MVMVKEVEVVVVPAEAGAVADVKVIPEGVTLLGSTG